MDQSVQAPDLTISQIERQNYTWPGQPTEKRKRGASIGAIKYLKDLAARSQTDISNWPVLKLFSDGKGGVISDRPKMNGIFFDYKLKAPAVRLALSPEALLKLRCLEDAARNLSARPMINQAERSMNYALSRHREYMSYMKTAAKAYAQAELIKGHRPDYARDVVEVEAEGFWKFSDIESDTANIVFETVNDVLLSYLNTQHGVKQSVNLGRFRVIYSIKDAVLFFQSITKKFRHVHPHIHANTMCFGDVRDEIHQFIAKGMIVPVMQICQKALQSYNPDSPYTRLEWFLEENKRLEDLSDEERQEEMEEVDEEQGDRDDNYYEDPF